MYVISTPWIEKKMSACLWFLPLEMSVRFAFPPTVVCVYVVAYWIHVEAVPASTLFTMFLAFPQWKVTDYRFPERGSTLNDFFFGLYWNWRGRVKTISLNVWDIPRFENVHLELSHSWTGGVSPQQVEMPEIVFLTESGHSMSRCTRLHNSSLSPRMYKFRTHGDMTMF